MHLGAIILITLIILACSGPGAILRALSGLGCLLMIGAILLGLLWIFVQIQNRSTARVQPAPALTQ
jgi:hypothetical protein